MQLLAPRCKGSRIALIVRTATRSPTLKCIHLYKPIICTCCWAGTERAVHVDTSRRTFAVALVLTISLNLRDSYAVKVKALANALYVCAPHFSTPPKGHFHRATGQRYECFLDWAKNEGKMYKVYIFLYESTRVKIINLSVYSEKSPKSPAQVTDIQTG